VNKSSVQAVDEAYRKQKEAEKQLRSLKHQAEQNRKIAEKEVQKLKKRIKLQSK
jgi:gamma-glutamyl:cysteine ligase YbdK (ATP-grasp superfamily)